SFIFSNRMQPDVSEVRCNGVSFACNNVIATTDAIGICVSASTKQNRQGCFPTTLEKSVVVDNSENSNNAVPAVITVPHNHLDHFRVVVATFSVVATVCKGGFCCSTKDAQFSKPI